MRIGEKVWHAKRINDKNAEIAEYAPPVAYVTRSNYLTVMPATSRGFMAMMQYGEDIENTWTVIANGRAFAGVFKVGDLMWVDGESPIAEVEQTYGNGSSATAEIKSAVEVNQTISVTLSRNKNQVTK